MHVASICFKCLRCFIGMLQVFHMNVAKVDVMLHMLQWLCTYVASFYCQCFICVFTHVASVFIWMLHMFHILIASVLYGCYVCLQVFFMCFCKCFIRIFQMFHLSSDACFKCSIGMF
jgi:hypothetical protein